MMQTMIEYVNKKNESVYLYYEEDNETNVLVNYNTKQCEVFNDVKNDLYDIMWYLCKDEVSYFDYINKNLLITLYEEINYIINDDMLYNNPKKLYSTMLDYIKDNNIEL